jgi:hypothetical protein
MLVRIHAASGNFVQQWFPDMRTRTVYQGDFRFALAAKAISETGGQFQASCTTPNYNDVMRI